MAEEGDGEVCSKPMEKVCSEPMENPKKRRIPTEEQQKQPEMSYSPVTVPALSDGAETDMQERRRLPAGSQLTIDTKSASASQVESGAAQQAAAVNRAFSGYSFSEEDLLVSSPSSKVRKSVSFDHPSGFNKVQRDGSLHSTHSCAPVPEDNEAEQLLVTTEAKFFSEEPQQTDEVAQEVFTSDMEGLSIHSIQFLEDCGEPTYSSFNRNISPPQERAHEGGTRFQARNSADLRCMLDTLQRRQAHVLETAHAQEQDLTALRRAMFPSEAACASESFRSRLGDNLLLPNGTGSDGVHAFRPSVMSVTSLRDRDYHSAGSRGPGFEPFRKCSTNGDDHHQAMHMRSRSSMNSQEPLPPLLQFWVKLKDSKLKHPKRKATVDMEPRPSSSRILESMASGNVVMKTKSLFDKETRSTCSAFVLSPAGYKKICWDILSSFVIAYDIAMLPLATFGADDTTFYQRMTLFTTLFWSMDLMISFFAGFHRNDGIIELRVQHTAMRYLKTWFPLDLLVLSLDWIIILTTSMPHIVRVLRLNRFSRIVRIIKVLRFVRLVRVFKLATVYEELCESVLSAPIVFIMNVTRLLLVLSFFVHYVACGWYAVGISQYPDNPSWLSGEVTNGASKPYLYLIAYHWTMAQFLPAPSPDHPRNPWERLYTVGVLFAGFMVFSSTLGSVTALITQTRKAAYQNLREEHTTRRFFKDNGISHELGTTIMHYLAQINTKETTKVKEADVPAFKRLPNNFRVAIRYELHSQSLSRCPIMFSIHESAVGCFREICDHVTVQVVLKGDVVFHFLRKAHGMCFVKSGNITYHYGCEDMNLNVSEDIKPETWLCEAALWTVWEHQGTACVQDAKSTTIRVDTTSFIDLCQRHLVAVEMCVEYAHIFVKRMEWAQAEGKVYVDDTFCAFENAEDLREWLEDRDSRASARESVE